MEDIVDPSILCEVKIEPVEDFECVDVKEECFVDIQLEVPLKLEHPDLEHSGKLLHKKAIQDIPLNTEDTTSRTFKRNGQTKTNNTNCINSRVAKSKIESSVDTLKDRECKLTENDNGTDKSNISLQQSVTNNLSNGEKHYSSDNQKRQYSKNSKRRKESEKRFQCSICDKNFNRNSSLIKHIRTHTGEKPFQCTICQKCFSEKCNLEIHTRIHTGVKPHQCTICEKSFSQKVDLKRHIRIHTGDKPFQCYLCKKCFNTKSNLDTHIRIHTGDKPYQCNVCKKYFNNNSNYITHVRIHMR